MSVLSTRLKAGPTVDRDCYVSKTIFDLEVEKIFERSWLFVAHESELKNHGDFRTAQLAGQPVLATRGRDGAIRVFLNSCRHRGALVELNTHGCRKQFQCLYHHWEYDTEGKLISVPRKEGFGSDFRAEDFGLVPLPRVETFHGLVFASFDDTAPSLRDYLGPAAPYLEEVATYSGRSMEALAFFECTYDGNWKLLFENTLDDYHAEYLHSHIYQSAPGFQYGTNYMRQGLGAPRAAVPERAPKEDSKEDSKEEATRSCAKLGLHALLEWHDPAEKMPFQRERTHRVNIGIFPSFLGVYHPVMDMTGLRVIKPERPDRTTVLNYCLAPSDLSDEEKRTIAGRFHTAWGAAGRIMMDDLRALNFVQRGLAAKKGGDVVITRGMQRSGDRGTAGDEHTIRGFWESWRTYMFDIASGVQAERH